MTVNVVFIHVAALGKYREITDELLDAIRSSKLGENACVTIGLVGNGDVDRSMPVDHVLELGSIGQFEFPTLAAMQSCARRSPEKNYLYIHTKGASTPDNLAILDWRHYMTHFCVNKWEQCVDKLSEGHDCVGVDWRTDPCPHYSGNFWWATGKYLASLPDIAELGKPDAPHVISVRHNAEFWIGMGNPKAACLWDCGINQYERHLHRYPIEKYNG